MIIDSPIISGSLLLTGSFNLIGNTAQTGSLNISGSVNTIGTITATTLVVQTITSSISAITGSTKFGELSTNTHQFTGSMFVTGALSGTSATFSSNVQLTGDGYVYGNATAGSGTIRAGIRFNSTDQELRFFTQDLGRLTIASTGAATFSGGLLTINVPTDNTTVGIFHAGGGTANRGLKISTFVATNDNAGVTLDAQTSTGVLAFATAGAEKMRITSDGNVGIGTSSPSRDPSGTRSLAISGVSAGFAASLDLYSTRNYAIYTGGGGSLGFFDLTANVERLTIASTGAATFSSSVYAPRFIATGNQGFSVNSWGTLTQTLSGQMTILGHNVAASDSANNQVNVLNGGWISSMIKQYYNEGITFHTSPTSYSAGEVYPMDTTERMRIRSSGNVGIGLTGNDGIRLWVKGQTSDSNTQAFNVGNSNGTDLFVVRNDGLINTGLATNSPYNNSTGASANAIFASDGTLQRSTVSSIRYKENINDWNGGLDIILALKPKTFNYKKDYYDKADIEFLGLIAEEVAEVSPYLADYENEDRTGQVENVRYATIVVPLIKAIQEQQAQIATLQEKLERNNIT
jgi:cytoskeletal protein CcmA (bactofilin family)